MNQPKRPNEEILRAGSLRWQKDKCDLFVFSQDIDKKMKSEGLVPLRLLVNHQEIEIPEEQGILEVISDLKIVVEDLEIWFDSKTELQRKVLRAWMDALPKLIAACDDIATQAKSKSVDPPLSKISEIIEGCYFFVETLSGLQIPETFPREPLRLKVQILLQALDEAAGYLERRDFLNLSDVFEYDVAQNLSDWLGVCRELLEDPSGQT